MKHPGQIWIGTTLIGGSIFGRRQQTADIEFAADAHEKLTVLVVRGGGLQELASIVSAMLAGAVAVLDETGDVLAATGGPDAAAGEAASFWRHPAVLAAMHESRARGQSVDVPGGDGACWRVAAAAGAVGLIGALVIRTTSALPPAHVRVFERSSLVLALIQLGQERRSASAREEAGYLVGGLLNPYISAGPELLARARALGFDPAAPVCVAALEIEGARHAHVARRLAEGLGRAPALVAELDGRIVALSAGEDPLELRDAVRRVMESIPELTWFGAVTGPPALQGALSPLHERLKRCLALLRNIGRSNAVVVEAEFAPYTLIFDKQGQEDVALFLRATVGPLLEQDARRNSRLAETLLAYLDHGHGAKATAAALGVHVNTLMNRLESIRALLGEWERHGRGAEIHLALRLWRLRSAG